MKLRNVCLMLFLFFPCSLMPMSAQDGSRAGVPRLANFTGKAMDAQGKAIAGIAGVVFAIYKDQYEGSPLWLETQNVQADAKGNYVVQLGATKSDGLPVGLFASGEARWLGVRVNGGEEQPRVMLLSVPYALKAGDAATIGGLPPSAFVLAAPPSGGAGGSSIDAASSNPAPGSPPPASTVTTSGGTVNALPLWTTATNVQSSAITQTGSGPTAKIGIGTTAPTTAFDVHGGSAIRGTLVLPATGAATASAGKVSQPENFVASSFSSATSTPVNQTFQWGEWLQSSSIAQLHGSTRWSQVFRFSGVSNPERARGCQCDRHCYDLSTIYDCGGQRPANRLQPCPRNVRLLALLCGAV